jgi:hypothetical protein
MIKTAAEKEYKKLHEYRIRLRCSGFLSDKENENIKKKIELWGRKEKIPLVSDYLATLKKVNSKKDI